MKKLLQILLLSFLPFAAAAQMEVDGMVFYPNYDENWQEDGTCRLQEYKGNDAVVTIPETIAYDGRTYTVTIVAYAFNSNSDITEVILPSSIKEIGDYSFAQCKNLEKINLPEGLLKIGQSAFGECALKEITLPSTLQELGKYAFSDCTSLQNVVLNEGLKKIGDRAFSKCVIEEITLPSTLQKLGERVFTYINKLHFNVLPQNIEIDDNAFKDTGIVNLILDNDVAKETCSFSGTFFENIIINDYVTDISGIDFSNSSNIYQIISMPENAPVCHEFNKRTLDNTILVINKNNNISYYNDSIFGNFFHTTVLDYPLSYYELVPLKDEDIFLNTYEKLRFSDFYKVEPEIDTYVQESWSGCTLYADSFDDMDAFSIHDPGVYLFVFTLGLNGKKLSFNVHVVSPALNIELNKTELTLLKGESIKLVAKIDPTNVTDPTITWISTNPAVASVDNGLVTAVGGGECDIVATTHNGLTATCHVSVPVAPEQISFESAEVSAIIGDKVTLNAILAPDDVTEKALSWATSDAEVATVENGVVSCIGLGEAVITATTVNGLSAECKITVNPIMAESITLDRTEVEAQIGETFTLTAVISPDDTTDKSVTWTSSDTNVASVEAGVVTCVGVGEAVITATTVNGLTATCAVTVTRILVESIVIDPSSIEGERGEQIQLTATVLPENATNKTLDWVSDDEFIAKVSETGLVTIISERVTSIHARATDGSGVEASCEVTGVAGVDELFVDGKLWNVITPDGILIRKNATKEDIEQLAPALYILTDGKRTVKLVKN